MFLGETALDKHTSDLHTTVPQDQASEDSTAGPDFAVAEDHAEESLPRKVKIKTFILLQMY